MWAIVVILFFYNYKDQSYLFSVQLGHAIVTAYFSSKQLLLFQGSHKISKTKNSDFY